MEKKKDLLYLGKEGLTNTAANYVANIAKEMIREDLAVLKSYNFIDESVSILNGGASNTLRKGMKKEDLDKTLPILERVVRIKSLIGWLREAMKAKDQMSEEIDDMSQREALDAMGCLEEWNKIEAPELKLVKEKDVIAQLDPMERRKLEMLKTRAAILGKFIHEDGEFSKARQEMVNSIGKPNSIEHAFNTVMVKSYSISLPVEEVDDAYFKVQAEQREAQAKLNSILFKVKEMMYEQNQQLRAEYKKKFADYKALIGKYDVSIEEWKAKEHKSVSELKIVIPAELQVVYDEVCNAVKK